ncbi:receptor-like protein 6 [Medicago truncatula]|nr:receptor-like protein 6 [Medicago truncatula]
MRIILVSFLLCYYFIYITHASTKCLEDQQSLLHQLKNNLTFNPEYSTKLILWNQSTACCNWRGVTCDIEGHVIGLDLSDEDIHGGFNDSSSLFSLQHLQKLNLADNYFNSSIPSGFNKLEKLTYLNLSYASFVGQIPVEISQLKRLVTLDLSSLSYLTGQGLKLENPNLQNLVRNFTSIRQLYLDGVIITAKGHEWSNALLPLRGLEELTMSNCNLTGPLDSSLSRLKNLSIIILDGNNFSSPVPETFSNFRNLTTLSLAACRLTDTFPHKIFQIGTLSFIDLTLNKNLHSSFPEFPLSVSIHTFRAGNTIFSGAIPHTISNMRNLSELDLSNSTLNGPLPNSLSILTELRYIDLSFNSFTGPMPSFCKAKSLIHLDLSHNQLSGTIPSSSHSEKLHHLVSIDLSYNFIIGSIPSSLFTLALLQKIQLSCNRFSKFDEFINVSSSVINTLDLSRNNLAGSVPTSIFLLRSLSVLDLSSNRLNGSLHLDKLLELRNLTALNLSYNNISINVSDANVDHTFFPKFTRLELATCNLKTFPNFLMNQSMLFHLDLSANQIHGVVPNWIWTLSLEQLNISHNFLTELEGPLENLASSYLYVVDLHNNQLQGPIPFFSKHAAYLDYSRNKFSSTIPQDIGNYLSSTYFLSLSQNNLQGSIPDSLCDALQLLVLDISYNNISGTISPCLMTMTNTLEALNLRKNNLTGLIPDMFPTSCGISTLNFHGNLLHGPIPKSLFHCSLIKVLDIGSNQIFGGFPCFLKNIPTLSVLVLRNNILHGSIECSHSLENKPWKMIQIVDIAFNNFNGKLPEKYFTSWERMKREENDNVSDFVHTGDSLLSYYQDSATVSNKGRQMELVKILTIFTTIDFSSNHFEGPIPDVLMDFKAIHVLNFSNNALSGEIPSTIGNLKQLESLDLSNNSLVGEIPVQLASMSFLSYLNLSFNHLVGMIPTGTQLQSFEASSFEGNDGLYGPPLTVRLDGKRHDLHPQPACGRLTCSIDWNFISVELGFVFGFGIVICPIMFWKQWRVNYLKLVDKILCWIFSRMYLEYVTDRGQTYTVLRL